MKTPPRCFVADTDAPSSVLDADARHHVERVLRLRPGDALHCVDGRGGLATGRLQPGGRIAIETRAPRVPAPAVVRLAVAPPRPARLDWLVEKAVELGVTEIVPLQTAHAAREVTDARRARLQRIADEALLQCRRLHRATVLAGRALHDVLEHEGEAWLADVPVDGDDSADGPRDTAGTAATVRRTSPSEERPLLLLVGPEGGFRPDEREAVLARGARRVCCGRGVLRVETAALALAVLANR